MTLARLLAAAREPAADADLLHAWATARDGDSFAELVRRYGPLVWAACRTVAGHTPAAEDAFQAAFLALHRRAGGVTNVPGFLHRTATRAARKAARRDRRRPAPPAPRSPDPLDRLTARELLQAVDAEIARLPERQRLAVLVCGVEGLSLDEAAGRLGWTPGAVRGRLQRGRATLRARLAARGLTVPAALGLGVVPDRLTAAVRPGGPVPAGVAELVPGGLTMKLWACGAVLAVGLAASGLGRARDKPAVDPPEPKPATDPLTLWEGTPGGAGSGVWHPHGKHVAAVGAFEGGNRPHEVRAWDAATGKLAASFPVPEPYHTLLEPHRHHLSLRDTLAVSPDGRRVAVGLGRDDGSARNVVAVWAWDRPADPPRLLPLSGPAAGVVFGREPAAGRLYAVTESGRLSAFRLGGDPEPVVESDLPRGPHGGATRATLGLVHHPTARVLAVAHDNDVSFWNPDTLQRLDAIYPQAPLWHHPITFRPDGRRLTLFGESGVGADRRLLLGGFDLSHRHEPSGDWVEATRVPPASDPLPSAGGKGWGLNHLSYSPDGRFLALAGKDETVRIADAVSGRVVADWPEAGPARAAHFSRDGRRLLTVANRAVRVRDVADKLVPRPRDRDLRLTQEKELDRFAGRWVVAAARTDGRDTAEAVGGPLGRVTAVDPAVTPKAATVRREAAPHAAEPAHAIYEFLDADTCRICYSLDPDRRPTAFTAEKGERQSLVVYKRVK